MRGDPQILAILLKYNADPNSPNDFRETPVHFACKRGSPALLRLLVEQGGKLDELDMAARGLVHHAAHGGSV